MSEASSRMKDSESSTRKFRSDVTELDLCRTGGCCPTALVDKGGVTILLPTDEAVTLRRDGKAYYMINLDKSHVDRIAMEIRRKS